MEEEKLLKRKQRARSDNNLEHLAHIHKKLGELYVSQDNYEDALQEYEEERKLWKILGKPMSAAVASRMMGEIYGTLGEFKEALKLLKEYLEVSKEENNLIEEQRALATIGRTYFFKAESFSGSNQNEYERSLREAKQAYMLSLKICDKINHIDRYELLQMRSRLMLNMGLVFECQDEVEKAVEHIGKAIAINVKADLFEDAYRCYSSMAALYHRQKNSVLSLKHHDLALEVAERLPDKSQLMSDTLTSKADVYFSVANYRAAKQTLTKAYRLCSYSTVSEEKKLIERNLKIAHVLCESEEKLVKMSDDDHQTMKNLYERMGDACCMVKNFSQAVIYYKKMLECCEALGYCGKELLPALVSLSQTYRDAGMYDEALVFLRRERDIWEDNAEEACKTSLNLVQVLEQKGENYNTIMEALKQSLDHALIARSEKLELKVLKHMLKVQEDHEHYQEAEETQNKMELLKADADVTSDWDESSDNDEAVESPDMIDNISLSDILDEMRGEKNVQSRQTRKPTQVQKLRRNEKGETQLQVACIAGNYHRVKQLIDLKHPVNVTDNGGWTPLHEVCNHGHTELVELLLDNGANINDPGGDGCEGITPLHDACSNGHLQIVEILLDRGACTDVRTNDNKTPYDFLVEWACRDGNLNPGDRGLFESVRERLRKGLDKAGVCSENSNVDRTILQLSGKPRRNSNTSQISSKQMCVDSVQEKRRRTVLNSGSSSSECSDDEATQNSSGNESKKQYNKDTGCAFGTVLMEDNPALEYQNIMQGLRRKQIQKSCRKNNKSIKSGVFVEDDDTGADWLIDDIKESVRPNKRRKIKSINEDGKKLIGTLKASVLFHGEESNSSVVQSDELTLMSDLDEKDMIQEMYEIPDLQMFAAEPANMKKDVTPLQSSMLDKWITTSPVEKPETESDSVCCNSDVESKTGVHSVKIHVEDTFLVVPLPACNKSGTITIDWLAKEAAKRFLRLKGRLPVLVLLTKDNATLTADDPISVINDDRELIAHVTSWKTVSLLQRYKNVCVLKDLSCDTRLEDALREADTSGCLYFGDCGLYVERLCPLILSLQHELSLKELVLSGNGLMDEGIEMFASLDGLPLLEILDLSCNNINSQGLKTLTSFLSSCQSLKVLDLSYNDFEYLRMESICNICESLRSLKSLSLESSSLNGEELIRDDHHITPFTVWNIEALNISYNSLGGNGVKGFLSCLNPGRLSHLNIAGTVLKNSSCSNEIIDFFRKDCTVNLQFLDLSDCDIDDTDLKNLLGFLKNCLHFCSLSLCNNKRLSSMAIEELCKMSNMPKELDLQGCDMLPFSEIEWDMLLRKLSSLTISITCKEVETGSDMWKREEIQKLWEQLWGSKAQILSGPLGFLKLNVL